MCAHGNSPAAVAVAVIRDNMRPALPDDDDGSLPRDYRELMTSCWHSDPAMRPTFLEAMTRLSGLSQHDDDSAASPLDLISSRIVYSSCNSSDTYHSSSADSHHSGSMYSAITSLPRNGDEITIVISDISRAGTLWEHDANAMRDATLMHNNILRAMMTQHGGYEVVGKNKSSSTRRNSLAGSQGSFCVAFDEVTNALNWCASVQRALLEADWPSPLVAHPSAGEEFSPTNDNVVLFKGVRVRMGVHIGRPKVVRDAVTRKVEYSGPVVDEAAQFAKLTQGGQVLVSSKAHAKFHSERSKENYKTSGSVDGTPESGGGRRQWSALVERPGCYINDQLQSGMNSQLYNLTFGPLPLHFGEDLSCLPPLCRCSVRAESGRLGGPLLR